MGAQPRPFRFPVPVDRQRREPVWIVHGLSVDDSVGAAVELGVCCTLVVGLIHDCVRVSGERDAARW